MQRFAAFIIMLAMLTALNLFNGIGTYASESTTIALGFLVISAYLFGNLFLQINLPRITGYIAAGLVLGPYGLHFLTKQTIVDLDFINHMALALIAFYAGGELKLEHLQTYRASLIKIISSQFLIVIGIGLILYFARSQFQYFSGMSDIQVLGVALLVGVICMARSPATAIAIIDETRSEGRMSEIVLGVTIALDVLVIVLFAIAISLCETLFHTGKSWDVHLLFILSLEIMISVAFGVALGLGLIRFMKYLHPILPIFLLTLGFLVVKFSYELTNYLEHVHGIGLKAEPLLICIAAGFMVQNYSRQGRRFMRSLDKVSLLIYALFFSISGASLDIGALRHTWKIASIIFVLRMVMIALTTTGGAMWAQDPKPVRSLYWLGFVAQAGVTLGFAYEIQRRFPEWGMELATILVAIVSLNQVVGPVTFKYGLQLAGEVKGTKSYRDLINKNTNK